MIKISKIGRSGEIPTLQVEGKIAGEGVALLESECRKWIAQCGSFQLDLSGVLCVDSGGRTLLDQCREAGVRLINPPSLLDLEGDAPCA